MVCPLATVVVVLAMLTELVQLVLVEGEEVPTLNVVEEPEQM